MRAFWRDRGWWLETIVAIGIAAVLTITVFAVVDDVPRWARYAIVLIALIASTAFVRKYLGRKRYR